MSESFRALLLAAAVSVGVAAAVTAIFGVPPHQRQARIAAMSTATAEAATTKLQPTTNASDGPDDPPSESQRRLDVSNRMYLIGASGAVAFGALGLIASFFIYLYSGRVSVEGRKEVERLRTQAVAAVAQAESAKADQARLALDLEREKVARAQFEAEFSWRIIPPGQKTALTQALKQSSHIVAIEFPSGDQEATFFALQLIPVFEGAGWKVVPRSVPSPQLSWGILVPGPENAAVKALREALTSANLSFGTDDVAVPGMFMGEQNPATPDCRLVVGTKMTAALQKLLAEMHQP